MIGEVEARPELETGKPSLPWPSREDTVAIPKCTTEGVGYMLEWWPCRFEGKRYIYIGENSRSSYQRGREHCQEVALGKRAHPLVLHFEDVHQDSE